MRSQLASTNNTLLIGMGPHAQKVYIPWFNKQAKQYNAHLKVIVELTDKAEIVKEIAIKQAPNARLVFVEPFQSEILPLKVANILLNVVKKYHINTVIIATEPSAHKPYVLWALQNGLHILMDKPITARKNAISSKTAAYSLLQDYDDVLEAYHAARKRWPNLICSVNVQRRYHPGFHKVFALIQDVTAQTGCPITSIQSSHADGQWRLPDDLIDLEYHGFLHGYGKASHSGYHFFDLLAQLTKYGIPITKQPEVAEVITNFTSPDDLLFQLNIDDYVKFFGSSFKPKYSIDTILEQPTFGEINAFALMRFKKDGHTVCNVQLSLLHNSFSDRSWILPSSDLYKGNGRIKHESHIIQQGPFQCIQVHSYQAKSSQDDSSPNDYMLGDSNHFEIHVFRNSRLIGGKKLEVISINDLLPNPQGLDLLTTVIKGLVVNEFFEYVTGAISREQLKSDLSTHRNSVALMCALYVSHINQIDGTALSAIAKLQ